MNTLLTYNPEILVEILIPLGVCVVLPCLIVFFLVSAHKNEINRKTEVALKAIESGVQIDPAFFTRHKDKKGSSVKTKIFICLIIGLILSGVGLAYTILSVLPILGGLSISIFSNLPVIDTKMVLIEGMTTLFVGLSLLAVYFIARKQFAAEIKAEEERIRKPE